MRATHHTDENNTTKSGQYTALSSLNTAMDTHSTVLSTDSLITRIPSQGSFRGLNLTDGSNGGILPVAKKMTKEESGRTFSSVMRHELRAITLRFFLLFKPRARRAAERPYWSLHMSHRRGVRCHSEAESMWRLSLDTSSLVASDHPTPQQTFRLIYPRFSHAYIASFSTKNYQISFIQWHVN